MDEIPDELSATGSWSTPSFITPALPSTVCQMGSTTALAETASQVPVDAGGRDRESLASAHGANFPLTSYKRAVDSCRMSRRSGWTRRRIFFRAPSIFLF